jgi:hypothetical protein
MDPASQGRKSGLWWRVAGVALLAFVCAAAFSAYLRPDMLIAFADVLSFCMSLLR